MTSPPTTPRVGLSTASVYPASTAECFTLAKQLGYDTVEVMVTIDQISQDAGAVRRLSEYHELPVGSVHAPTLLLTQRVWGTEPWGKLERSAEMAIEVGAPLVVLHPPFRWQREYAAGFVEGVTQLTRETGVVFAVENMYPWRAGRAEVEAYAPGFDPVPHAYEHLTLDVSHASTADMDVVETAEAMGDRLAHVHLTDGTGSMKDEHLVPGRGRERCAELLQGLVARGYTGDVVVEINTRRCSDDAERLRDLAASLDFARSHLG